MLRIAMLTAAMTTVLVGPVGAQRPAAPPAPLPRTGWMDLRDTPDKHPGPCAWLRKEDAPEQAALRKELAGAGRIAYCTNRDGNWEIYSCRPDGGENRNLTNSPAWDFYPRFTPDGKILFFSDRDSPAKLAGIYDQLLERQQWGMWGYFGYPSSYNTGLDKERPAMRDCGIYMMDADGSNVKLVVKQAMNATMSPDGKLLVFERESRATARNLETGEEFGAVRKYWNGGWWPEYSPDGGRVLIASGGDVQGSHEPALQLMATIFDLLPDRSGRSSNFMWNLTVGSMTICPRWRPDGNGVVIVQGSREMNLQEIDLAEPPNENGWRVGRTIGLAKPANRWMHAYPAYCPAGKYIAFSLSPIHYLVRELKGPQGIELKDMGYKPWKDGNQVVWQELCVGRAVPGQDNVYVQITEGGFSNRNADWWAPPEARVRPAKPITAESVKDSWKPKSLAAPTAAPARSGPGAKAPPPPGGNPNAGESPTTQAK